MSNNGILDVGQRMVRDVVISENVNLDSTTSTTFFHEEFFSTLSLFFTFLMVLMCVIGAIMNTVSLMIFTRPTFRRRSINILLAGLSASDLCLCILAIPVFSLNQLQVLLPSLSYRITNQILIYAYPVTLMAQTMSVWMLVSITVDRYLAVCHPFSVQIYCTRTRAMLTVLIIFIFSIGYNFVRFWEYTIIDDNATSVDETTKSIETTGTTHTIHIVGLLRENHYYMILYQNIALLLTQFILPLLVLGFLNVQVASTILESSETRRVLAGETRREHNLAKMMMFVVIGNFIKFWFYSFLVFIFCYLLSFSLNLLEIFNPELFKNPIGFLLNDVNNVLVVINSSSSFIFYVKYSSRYRAQLRLMRKSGWRVSLWLLCCFLGDQTKTYGRRKSTTMIFTGYSSVNCGGTFIEDFSGTNSIASGPSKYSQLKNTPNDVLLTPRKITPNREPTPRTPRSQSLEPFLAYNNGRRTSKIENWA